MERVRKGSQMASEGRRTWFSPRIVRECIRVKKVRNEPMEISVRRKILGFRV